MASAPKRTRASLAIACAALCATVLWPVSAVGADASQATANPPGKPGYILGSWGTGANASTMTVSWTPPGGTYLEYDLFYRIDSGTVYNPAPQYPASGWSVGPAGVRSSLTTIAGLDSTKTYAVAVRARDRETGLYGFYGLSGLIEPTFTPGRIGAISETARTATSLSLAWNKVLTASGGYEIRVSEDTATKSWGAVRTVTQPLLGATVSAQLTTANLPSGFSNSKTYVAQVRSKSATGTCGSGSVKCSRWVQSGALAQLDISGLEVTHVLPDDVPVYVETMIYDMRAEWDALPAELTGVTYQARFYYRSGNPADHYIATDDNSALHAIPDSWYQDWLWYSLCNDSDATNDPARGCAKPCSDTWGFENCQRTTPYPKPQFYFNGGPGWAQWFDVPASACGTTGGKRTCSYTFPLSAPGRAVTKRAQVRAVNGATTGPASEWTNKGSRPPTRPNRVWVCAPSGASVRVEWKRAFHNGGTILGYDIDLHKAASGQNPAGTTTVSGTTGTLVSATDPRRCHQSPSSTLYGNPYNPVFFYMFHGAETNRSYSAVMRAFNSHGTGPARGSSSVSLTPTAPPAPAPPSVAVTANSATLTWAAPADNGGNAVTGYGVRYRAQNADDTWPSDWTVHTRTGTGTTVTETVASLTAATKHQFQVQACNATGLEGATACSPWSAATEVTTSTS